MIYHCVWRIEAQKIRSIGKQTREREREGKTTINLEKVIEMEKKERK